MKTSLLATALLATSIIAAATPPAAPAAGPAIVRSANDEIMITRDPNEVKGMKKVGEVEGRSPFFGLSGKMGDKGAAKKIREAAAKLGATKILIVSEDRMGATTLRGVAYK